MILLQKMLQKIVQSYAKSCNFAQWKFDSSVILRKIKLINGETEALHIQSIDPKF